MTPLKRVATSVCVGLAWLVSSSVVLAEDTKGKWQFGFGLSYFATTDYIRSNADLAIANGVVGDNGLPSVGSTDDRPDINIMNQASIHDDFKFDFSASYGLTRWLAVEAAVGYIKAHVGNMEFYNENVTQFVSPSPNDTTITAQANPACGPDAANQQRCWEWIPSAPDRVKNNTFLPVGTITEIPINLSGLIRFRPESPLDPYIGVGVGYIMTDLKKGDEFQQKEAVIADPRFIVSAGDEGEYNINSRCRRVNGESCVNFHPGPLDATTKNAFEWHAIGGADYYMTDHMSVYVDARYVWTSGSVDIRTDDAHQVRFALSDPGNLEVFVQGAPGKTYDPTKPDTWYLWEDIGVPANADFHTKICPACQGDGMLETEDKNLNGSLDAACGPGTPNFCEDAGWLYQIPPGTRSIDEALRMPCDACKNGKLDTEDVNGNGYLDRYLVYGLDFCSTPQAIGSTRCKTTVSTPRYVWPEGCPMSPDNLGPFAAAKESGCPAFLTPHTVPDPSNPSQPLLDPITGQPVLVYPSFQGTGADNAADTYIIQGGRIRMGGFGIGVGFKFTF